MVDEKSGQEAPFGPKFQKRIDRKTLALDIARGMLSPEERRILDGFASVIDRPSDDADALERRIAHADKEFPSAREIELKLADLQQKILKSGKG